MPLVCLATGGKAPADAEKLLAQAAIDIASGRRPQAARLAAQSAQIAARLDRAELLARALAAEGQALWLAGERARASQGTT